MLYMKNFVRKRKALFASLLGLFLLASCSGSPTDSSTSISESSSSEDASSSSGTSSSSESIDSSSSDSSSSSSEDTSFSSESIDSSSSDSSSSSEYVDTLPSDVNDGLILHCFDWTFKQIEDNLDTIASLGYKAVQTSPVTQPKSGGSIWYYFYQPVSYSIATSSPLGGKEELTSLCEAAEERGIAVICDIVFNHMATTGGTNSDGTPDIDPEVATYEPYIYEHRDELFHHSTDTSEVTQCYEGLPDIDTSNPYIQERSLSLLKECIDCGVDGFRFDAAKHIETPDDPYYPSDFWTNTLEVAKDYYSEKTGGTLYAYGEILGAPGYGRSISNYTKLMKVTESSYIDKVYRSLIVNKSASVSAITNTSYDVNSSITWVESHDTVLHDETNWTFDQLVMLWAYMVSRQGTQSLFFARTDVDNDSCTVGTIGSYDWNSPYFGQANKFHNRFADAEENRHASNDFYIDERYSSSDAGALIIDVKSAGSGTVTFNNLPDGTYYDQMTGSEVIVSGSSADITFETSNKSVMFLTKSRPVMTPILTVSHESGTYTEEFTLTLTLENAIDATITIDDGEPIHWNDTYSLVIGDDEGEVTNISIWYTSGTSEGTKELVFTKLTLIEGYFNIINLDPTCLSDYELYVWSWYPNSWSKPYIYDEESGYLLIPNETLEGLEGFLLALFTKGHEITNTSSWDSACLKQTADIDPSAGYFDASNFHM